MSVSITYSARGEIVAEELGALLRLTNMGDYSRAKLQGIISGSTTYATARDGRALVGFGRLLSDHATIAYINNMAVHPEYQRQGIGTRLLNLLFREAGDVNSILLYTNTADSLYTRVGFELYEKRLYILRLAKDE